jgi:hypothetical protein
MRKEGWNSGILGLKGKEFRTVGVRKAAGRNGFFFPEPCAVRRVPLNKWAKTPLF